MERNTKFRGVDDRQTLNSHNAFARAVQSQSLRSATPGLRVQSNAGGTSISYRDPNAARWVFVVGFDGNYVLCKEAVGISGRGWQVSIHNEDILRILPAPNYRLEHFEEFEISASQPTDKDQVCRFIGGYLVPDHRWAPLVDPPDPADCASCT